MGGHSDNFSKHTRILICVLNSEANHTSLPDSSRV